ncbi:MAG: hypothetical protein KDJ35_05765 [Alphaproteobacteria bacterium]|nr:hypothetical protein [Alphaproteobacteria bacterium]
MTIDRKPIIGVMGSHEKSWEELATPIGHLIADHDYRLLTGAGGGVMTAVAKAFSEREGRQGVSLGIIPTIEYDGGFVPREEYPNPYIELPIFVPLDKKAVGDTNPYSRNHVNVMTSNAMVILPGEHGTRNEVSLGIQYKKPMILFGPEKEFESFPEQPMRSEDIEEVREFLEQATAKVRTGEVY